jgi:hypothetical protein
MPNCQDLCQKIRPKAWSADQKSNPLRTIMAQLLGITGPAMRWAFERRGSWLSSNT